MSSSEREELFTRRHCPTMAVLLTYWASTPPPDYSPDGTDDAGADHDSGSGGVPRGPGGPTSRAHCPGSPTSLKGAWWCIGVQIRSW
jgi:hypothetical protein